MATRPMLKAQVKLEAEVTGSVGSNLPLGSVLESITPAAERHARALRLYGSFLLAKHIVRQTIPSLTGLYIDVSQDPDEGGYPTICFTLTVPEAVDRALELDDVLQEALYKHIPPQHRMYLAFNYRFN